MQYSMCLRARITEILFVIYEKFLNFRIVLDDLLFIPAYKTYTCKRCTPIYLAITLSERTFRFSSRLFSLMGFLSRFGHKLDGYIFVKKRVPLNTSSKISRC